MSDFICSECGAKVFHILHTCYPPIDAYECKGCGKKKRVRRVLGDAWRQRVVDWPKEKESETETSH